jgi:hypothetical protein
MKLPPLGAPDVYAAMNRWLDIGPSRPYQRPVERVPDRAVPDEPVPVTPPRADSPT